MQPYEIIQLLCMVIENERSKTTVSNNLNHVRNRHLATVFSKHGVPVAEVADPDITMYMDSQGDPEDTPADTVLRDGGELDTKPAGVVDPDILEDPRLPEETAHRGGGELDLKTVDEPTLSPGECSGSGHRPALHVHG